MAILSFCDDAVKYRTTDYVSLCVAGSEIYHNVHINQ